VSAGRGARSVGHHAEGRRAARQRRLRHARLRPQRPGHPGRAGPPAGDGQRDVAQRGATALHRGDEPRAWPPSGRQSVSPLHVPQLGFRVGLAGLPHRRRQCQAHDGRRRPLRWPHDQATGGQGRLPRPHRQAALYSDSSRKVYQQHLASYRHEDSVITVAPYDVAQLEAAFADADKHGWFIEAMFLEPVMGEGDPGRAVTTEFYRAARALTESHGSLLLVDSIQAGLRAHGVLSITDYPGCEKLPAPDMETFSKALNAGQYPLSVLAVTEATARLYRKGIYGNTMTANPRALDVALATLGELSDDVRSNIRERGKEFVDKLNALKHELGGLITKVQGTGLLFSCELAPEYKCYGADSTEEFMREHGIGVIHGGTNSLRFTPHFKVTSAEVDLIVSHVRKALLEGPRKAKAEAA